ncbi:MAG: hypothetical protein HOP33_16325 [Verrucomicrobia bacterium]|nr:hypothetical protein [Verrucomicrobiota bacterium]
MKEPDEQPEPKPQPAVPPPRPPRGPKTSLGFEDDSEPDKNPGPKEETVQINLPPKPSATPTIKLPVLPPGGPTGLTSTIKTVEKHPWWKFWKT